MKSRRIEDSEATCGLGKKLLLVAAQIWSSLLGLDLGKLAPDFRKIVIQATNLSFVEYVAAGFVPVEKPAKESLGGKPQDK